MKKKALLGIGIGFGAAFLAACAVVKRMYDKDYEGVSSADRGVSPVDDDELIEGEDEKLEETHDHDDDEVKDLKADAINYGYKPIDY